MLFNNYTIENIQNIGYEILNNYSNVNRGKKCCVINKKVVPNNYFDYQFKVSNMCDRSFSNNRRTIFENEIVDDVKFNLNDCQSKKKYFGSCRKMGGFECLDFVTKNECDQIPMMHWFKESCNTPIPYVVRYYKWRILNGDSNDIRKVIG